MGDLDRHLQCRTPVASEGRAREPGAPWGLSDTLPQDPGFHPGLTVEGMLAAILVSKGQSPRRAPELRTPCSSHT